MNRGRLKLALAVSVVGALAAVGLTAAPTAGAAVTASTITTPTDPSFFIADNDAATQTFAIAGTTTGGTTGDYVDINCYSGPQYVTVAASVPVNADGSFSVAQADLSKLEDGLCTLRAVPAGTTPSDPNPFAGPRVGVGERDSVKVNAGPNTGKVFDYYLFAQQQSAAFDYSSLGGCGLTDGYLGPFFPTTTFYCNAALFATNANPATRSELQIDGANAYPPEEATRINAQAAGLPALSYTYTLDPHTGDLVIHETDPLVKCTDPTYPPTTSSCATFVSAGVTDQRTISQDNNGHIAWITDLFTSTDGGSHTLDLLWDNAQRFRGSTGDSSQVEFEFPGQSSYSTHVVGNTVSLPGTPGTILVRMHGTPDGYGEGAIVYDRPATAAAFNYVASDSSNFALHQTGTVPAGGSTRFRFAYVQDNLAANVAAEAQTATNAFLNQVTVSKTGTGDGTVTSSPTGIDCGATCSSGYPYGTSVTLTATPSQGSTFDGWSGACTGTGTCSVTTTDAMAVTAKFTPRDCVVPKVTGEPLKKAKAAIKHAYCSLGNVKTGHSARVKAGRVISEKPKAHTRLPFMSSVTLVVSKGKPAPKHKH